MNASKPSEYPPSKGEKCRKTFVRQRLAGMDILRYTSCCKTIFLKRFLYQILRDFTPTAIFISFETNALDIPRALSLQNLVSGYECGRVFPAGAGPGSPSRDAANWLPSRFSLSVETRQRYGWLRMVFPGARLSQAPIWCPSRGVAARERQGALSRRAW